MEQEEKMKLWNNVSKTTSETKTKEVSYGSRKFTAIDAYSQIRTATSEFGKYGDKWGFKEVKYEVIENRLYFLGTFFYPDGEYPIFNDCKVGDDSAKKVFTDSLTKALSYLGFNADVFMGQFEGNKYTGKSESSKTDTGNLPWIADENISNLKKLTDEGQSFTIKDIRAKYKVSKANAEKLSLLGIN